MRRLALALFLVAPAGCYTMNLDEFDSAARWLDPVSEPVEVDWNDQPYQFP